MDSNKKKNRLVALQISVAALIFASVAALWIYFSATQTFMGALLFFSVPLIFLFLVLLCLTPVYSKHHREDILFTILSTYILVFSLTIILTAAADFRNERIIWFFAMITPLAASIFSIVFFYNRVCKKKTKNLHVPVVLCFVAVMTVWLFETFVLYYSMTYVPFIFSILLPCIMLFILLSPRVKKYRFTIALLFLSIYVLAFSLTSLLGAFTYWSMLGGWNPTVYSVERARRSLIWALSMITPLVISIFGIAFFSVRLAKKRRQEKLSALSDAVTETDMLPVE